MSSSFVPDKTNCTVALLMNEHKGRYLGLACRVSRNLSPVDIMADVQRSLRSETATP